MLLEITRLAVGLTILLLHRPIADFVLAQERPLVLLLRQRGLPFPYLRNETAHDLYFLLGVLVCLLQFVRIWNLLR